MGALPDIEFYPYDEHNGAAATTVVAAAPVGQLPAVARRRVEGRASDATTASTATPAQTQKP